MFGFHFVRVQIRQTAYLSKTNHLLKKANLKLSPPHAWRGRLMRPTEPGIYPYLRTRNCRTFFWIDVLPGPIWCTSWPSLFRSIPQPGQMVSLFRWTSALSSRQLMKPALLAWPWFRTDGSLAPQGRPMQYIYVQYVNDKRLAAGGIQCGN
jgi:hypothetical protein